MSKIPEDEQHSAVAQLTFEEDVRAAVHGLLSNPAWSQRLASDYDGSVATKIVEIAVAIAETIHEQLKAKGYRGVVDGI